MEYWINIILQQPEQQLVEIQIYLYIRYLEN